MKKSIQFIKLKCSINLKDYLYPHKKINLCLTDIN